MYYSDLAELLEVNKYQVAEAAAKTIIARKIPFYSLFSSKNLAERLLSTLEMMIRYLRTNDIEEWRNYIISVSARWQEQGSNVAQVNAAGNVIIEKIRELVEQELSSPQDASRKTRFLLRVQGLATLANISAFNSSLKKS